MLEGCGLIRSKLKMPLPRKNALLREKLLEALGQIYEHKVVLVRGLAGSGKTTTAATFAASCLQQPPAWVSLDESMNNAHTFWAYLISACGEQNIFDQAELMQTLNSTLSVEDLTGVVLHLINLLDREQDILLALDDFHHLDDPAVVSTFEFFVKNSSDNLHFLILSRGDLPFYSGDLKMAGRFLEIGDESLKFSGEEGMAFLKTVMGLSLPEARLKEMNQLAEGWCGALQLIALAASVAGENTQAYHHALKKYLTEYLSREILDSLSPEQQGFLIRTSFLRYFSPGLADELLGIGNSAEIISTLIEHNLFLVNVGEGEEDFRYHSIFGEFLGQCFDRLLPEEQRSLRNKAAAALKQRGNYEGCLEQLLINGEFEQMLQVIAETEDNFSSWAYLVKIPVEYIINDPDATIQRIVYHFANNEWEQCFHIGRALEPKLKDNPLASLVYRFVMFMQEGRDRDEVTVSLKEIAGMPLKESTKSILYINMAVLLQNSDRFHDSLDCLARAAELNSRRPNDLIKYYIAAAGAQANEDMGNLARCRPLYDQIYALIERKPALSHLLTSTKIGDAGVLIKQMELERAKEFLDSVAGDPGMRLPMFQAAQIINNLEILLLQNKKEEARALFEPLSSVGFEVSPVFWALGVRYMFYLFDNNDNLLEQYAQTQYNEGASYEKLDTRLARARIAILKHQEEYAIKLLDDVIKQARKDKVSLKLTEALLLKIRILKEAGLKGDDHVELINLLREAVNYSYRDRILYLYVLEAEVVRPLLPVLLQKMAASLELEERNFILLIQKTINVDGSNQGESLLSDREKEVLAELATGATNKEIAERLCISVATVKTHIISIYSKLHVSNRVEAAERAREYQW